MLFFVYFSKSCDKTLVLHFFGLKKCEKDFLHFDDSFLTSDAWWFDNIRVNKCLEENITGKPDTFLRRA